MTCMPNIEGFFYSIDISNFDRVKINHDWFLAIIIYTLNVDFRKIFDKYQNKLTEQIELHKNVFDLTLKIPLL